MGGVKPLRGHSYIQPTTYATQSLPPTYPALFHGSTGIGGITARLARVVRQFRHINTKNWLRLSSCAFASSPIATHSCQITSIVCCGRRFFSALRSASKAGYRLSPCEGAFCSCIIMRVTMHSYACYPGVYFALPCIFMHARGTPPGVYTLECGKRSAEPYPYLSLFFLLIKKKVVARCLLQRLNHGRRSLSLSLSLSYGESLEREIVKDEVAGVLRGEGTGGGPQANGVWRGYRGG